ncbi:MAG: hypothetical protein ACO1RT_20060 [Planctomycetaceae bacterium]
MMLQSLLATALPTGSRAEPPQVQRLFPPGGMRGQTVEVELKGKLDDEKIDVWTNPAGLKWEPKEKGKFQVAIPPDADAGVHFVRFFNNDGASALHRFIVGTTPEINELEPNNRVGETQLVDAVPRVINGLLEKSGDADIYTLRLTAGSILVASIDAERFLSSPMDACLQVVDEKGNVLAMNLDYHGLDPHIAWTVPRDGLYGVRVFGFPATPDSSIRLAGGDNYLYRLTLTAGPYLEATVPLAVSSTTDTTLHPQGWNMAAVGEPQVVEAKGVSEAAQDGYRVLFAGTTGSLMLPVVKQPIFVASSALGGESLEPTPVTIPASITGCLSRPEAEDVIVFHVKKGERLVAALESRALGYPLDAVLRVESPDGKQLTREDDSRSSRDPSLRWTAPADGEYRLVVSEVNGLATPHGYYRLALTHESPSFAVTTSSDLVTGKVNEPISLTLAIARQNGFDGRLTMQLVDPPPGLEAQPIISEAKGDTAKEVKWNITAKQPFNGPIRVAVTSEPVAADASSPAFVTATSSQLEDLWLVALP